MTDKRKELSKILIKHNMPTRQAAINEIMQWAERIVIESKRSGENKI